MGEAQRESGDAVTDFESQAEALLRSIGDRLEHLEGHGASPHIIDELAGVVRRISDMFPKLK